LPRRQGRRGGGHSARRWTLHRAVADDLMAGSGQQGCVVVGPVSLSHRLPRTPGNAQSRAHDDQSRQSDPHSHQRPGYGPRAERRAPLGNGTEEGLPVPPPRLRPGNDRGSSGSLGLVQGRIQEQCYPRTPSDPRPPPPGALRPISARRSGYDRSSGLASRPIRRLLTWDSGRITSRDVLKALGGREQGVQASALPPSGHEGDGREVPLFRALG
jgi:hypothetical protein